MGEKRNKKMWEKCIVLSDTFYLKYSTPDSRIQRWHWFDATSWLCVCAREKCFRDLISCMPLKSHTCDDVNEEFGACERVLGSHGLAIHTAVACPTSLELAWNQPQYIHALRIKRHHHVTATLALFLSRSLCVRLPLNRHMKQLGHQWRQII